MEKGCNKRVDILTRCIIRRVRFKWGYVKQLRIMGRERWNPPCLGIRSVWPPGTDTHTHVPSIPLGIRSVWHIHTRAPRDTHTQTHTHTCTAVGGCWSVLSAPTRASHALLLQSRAILSCPLTNTEMSVMNLLIYKTSCLCSNLILLDIFENVKLISYCKSAILQVFLKKKIWAPSPAEKKENEGDKESWKGQKFSWHTVYARTMQTLPAPALDFVISVLLFFCFERAFASAWWCLSFPFHLQRLHGPAHPWSFNQAPKRESNCSFLAH